MAPQPFYEERGTPIAVRMAAEALAAQGHDVDLLSFHLGQDVTMPGVTHHRIARPLRISRVPIGFSLNKLICDLWMLFAAARLLARRRYDVLHGVEEAIFLAWPLASISGARLVYDADSILSEQIADKWPRARLLTAVIRWCERAAFRRSDLVLAVCPAIADAAKAVAEAERVHLLPDIAQDVAEGETDDDLRAIAGGRPVALYVGNLESYQGVELLIEALARIDISARPTLIIIGGDQAGGARCAALARRLGVDGEVRLLGPRPLDQLGPLLGQADIVCSPRIKGRNTPMKIFSYMASQRAILATDIDSHSQVLDQHCALLVPASAQGLADGMLRLCHDPALRLSLGRTAAIRARNQYSHSAFVDRLERAYALLVTGPAATAAALGEAH